jgi:hypothetical protein
MRAIVFDRERRGGRQVDARPALLISSVLDLHPSAPARKAAFSMAQPTPPVRQTCPNCASGKGWNVGGSWPHGFRCYAGCRFDDDGYRSGYSPPSRRRGGRPKEMPKHP